MSKMRAMIVPEPGGRFRMEERDLPEPGRHEVRIRYTPAGSAIVTPSPSKASCRGSAIHAFPAMK
jgi:Zn-dependent alcohol dehydrogenase